jgi:hypothetical protein
MHRRTVAILNELRAIDWFTNIGKQDSGNVFYVESWTEAVASCTGVAWESLCLEASNHYKTRLFERNRERFRSWNPLVREMEESTVPLVQQKTKDIVKANQLPEGFLHTVKWDILHLCMEAEYADVFPPGFFVSQAYWYLKGHFPCGWEGIFPDGRLMIF